MELAIFAGSANLPLAEGIAEALGIRLGRSTIARFPDEELHVQIKETVRACDVFLVQPTGPPPDRNLMELVFLADACRRAGAAQMTAITPYFGYARQDRRASGREAVGARIAADLLKTAGLERVVAVDLHTTAIEGAFGIPLEHVSAVGLLCNALTDVPSGSVVVAPDLGAVKLAERYARTLHLPMAVIHKVRISGEAVEARGIIGEVRGRKPLIVDDMISTGATIQAALNALMAAGCDPDAIVVATHALLVRPAVERLAGLPIKHLLVTNSLQIPVGLQLPIQVAGLAPLLAEVTSRLHVGESLGDLIVHG